MWRYRDPEHREWDVVLGRESWGAMMALFVPREGDGAVRQTPLTAGSYEQALQEVEDMGDEGLGALFSRSEPKRTTGGTDAG